MVVVNASPQEAAIAGLLIGYTEKYFKLLNSRSFSEVYAMKTLFHPIAYKSECQTSGATRSFSESIAGVCEAIESSPELEIKIVDVSAEVNDKTGLATVFIHTDWTNFPPGLVTERIQSFHWERFDTKWLCVKSTILRGVNEVV